MEKRSTLVLWLKEIRANFLILSVFLTLIGGAAAHHDGTFNLPLFLVTVIGVVSAHISVDLFNEYSDWKTGVDLQTVKTPFSGGSGNLQEGVINPSHVNKAAWTSLVCAFVIGVYLATVSGRLVLVFMAVGGATIVFYSEHLTRWMLGELMSGISLGSLVVIGSYYVQTGTVTTGIVWASIPPGILTSLLLFLNEFPDEDADRAGGRRHMVIVLGKQTCSFIYTSALISLYVVILTGLLTGVLPKTLMVSFFTFPLALYTSRLVLLPWKSVLDFIPAQGMNVIVVLGTDFLMALGYFLG